MKQNSYIKTLESIIEEVEDTPPLTNDTLSEFYTASSSTVIPDTDGDGVLMAMLFTNCLPLEEKGDLLFTNTNCLPLEEEGDLFRLEIGDKKSMTVSYITCDRDIWHYHGLANDVIGFSFQEKSNIIHYDAIYVLDDIKTLPFGEDPLACFRKNALKGTWRYIRHHGYSCEYKEISFKEFELTLCAKLDAIGFNYLPYVNEYMKNKREDLKSINSIIARADQIRNDEVDDYDHSGDKQERIQKIEAVIARAQEDNDFLTPNAKSILGKRKEELVEMAIDFDDVLDELFQPTSKKQNWSTCISYCEDDPESFIIGKHFNETAKQAYSFAAFYHSEFDEEIICEYHDYEDRAYCLFPGEYRGGKDMGFAITPQQYFEIIATQMRLRDLTMDDLLEIHESDMELLGDEW